ncbi:MAG: molybdenum cofactor synthesis domain-containing protein [Planctomycetota bacterium]
MGKVESLCASARKGERKRPLPRATFIAGHGIEGDAHAGPWHRQVSILDADDVDAVRRAGLADLAPGDFAENVVLSGVDLRALGLGSRLRLGRDVVLSITQIGKACHRGCAIREVTGDCIMPRLGLFARVETGGEVAVGDPAEATSAVDRSAFQAVVLTVSDRSARGGTRDTAGPAVAALLEDGLGAHVFASEIVPDEKEMIAERLRHYSDGHSIDLVVTVGGTGFSPRDVTPEATRDVLDRLAPGLDEAMRRASSACTPHAMLSRGVSGMRGSTLVVNLPGSERAALENLRAILGALPHGLAKLRGDPSDCGRSVVSTVREREET